MRKWTRRTLLGVGGIVGGGLLIGMGEFLFAPNRLRVAPGNSDGARLTTWIRLSPDNSVTVIVPHCEMGQGAQTGLAMMLAEELDAAWPLVRVEEAPASDEYAAGYMVRGFGFGNADIPPAMLRGADHLTYKIADWMGLQVTGGSGSIRFTGEYGMRVAGATAKQLLLQAAANRWNVPMSELSANASHVHHASSDKQATYGELANDAAQLPLPHEPTLKSRETFSLIGTSLPRLDIPAKVNGGAMYGLDVQLPDMVYAAIKAAPVFGSKLQSVNTSTLNGRAGIIQIVQLADAVAVVADGYWRAQQAINILQPVFDDANAGNVSSDSIFSSFAAALDKKSGAAAREPNEVHAEYRVPYLAHATMEPMNATARIVDGRCEVWAGTQDPLHARHIAAKACGLKITDVTIHNLQLGGGFGRRLPGALDYVDQAVRLAKAVSPRPVKLIWSREEDFRHDFYRSAVLGRFRATLDTQGKPKSWGALFTGNAGEGAAEIPYAIPKQSIARTEVATHIRLGSWRSVDHTQHGFFTESFIDELAHAAKQDPFEYRRQLLSAHPRHKAILELAAAKADWGAPLAPGRARGIAIVESFGTIVCEVAEIELLPEQTHTGFAVRRVVAAVDCGDVVNPDAGIAQIEGGIIFGLSAAFFGEITIDKGAVVQGNFDRHPMVRMADAPRIEVYFLASHAQRGGLGEPGVPPIAPAVANALFAATQQRIRNLPIGPLRKLLA